MQDWLREKTGAGLGDSEMNHSLNPKPLNHKPSHPKPLNLNPPTVSRKENQSALSFTRCQETESRSPVRCHACRLRFDGSGMVWGFRSFWFRGLGIGVYLKSQTLPVIRNIPEKTQIPLQLMDRCNLQLPRPFSKVFSCGSTSLSGIPASKLARSYHSNYFQPQLRNKLMPAKFLIWLLQF